MTTIYQQLGEGAGIRKAVDAFYDRVLADPQVAHYFADVDVSALRRHQAALLSTVTGGPAIYTGRDLAVAHAHLGITEEHFLRVTAHLVTVLQLLGVEADAVQQVTDALMAHRDGIVGAPEPAAASRDAGTDTGPRGES